MFVKSFEQTSYKPVVCTIRPPPLTSYYLLAHFEQGTCIDELTRRLWGYERKLQIDEARCRKFQTLAVLPNPYRKTKTFCLPNAQIQLLLQSHLLQYPFHSLRTLESAIISELRTGKGVTSDVRDKREYGWCHVDAVLIPIENDYLYR